MSPASSWLWIPLALTCALSLATGDALLKRALHQGHNEYLPAWLRLCWSLPVILLVYLLVPHPRPQAGFYPTVLTALPLEVAALLLYVKALKLSPLSLTVPFLSLTPIFLLAVPTLLLGERLTPAGGMGVALIAIGSYALHLRSLRRGVLAPVRAIIREPGSICMIAVAMIFSITSTLGKKAITLSSPIYFASFYFPLLAVLLTPIVLWRGRGSFPALRDGSALKAAAWPGLCYAVELVTHMLAVSLTNVAYMIAVKRLSLLLGVVYGHLLFREAELRQRLFGAGLMVAGVALILLGG